MERKPKVTQEAVNTACGAISKDGREVTVNGVIAVTGGSFGTVGPMVKNWRKEQESKKTVIIEMPDSVREAASLAAADIWKSASYLAGERVEAIEKETGEALAKASAELAEYESEVTRLETALSSAQADIKKCEGALQSVQDRLAQMSAQNAALETRLEDRDSELARLRADYEALQGELIAIARERHKDGEPKKEQGQ